MFVTFIIVIPNAKEEFKHSIESVLNQSVKDYELIIVLDRDINDIEENEYFCNLYKDNKNIKLVFNNNRYGSSYSWNIGLELCQGKYVKFISQGDTIEKDFVIKIQNKLKEHDSNSIDVIEYSFNFVNDNQIPSKSFLESNKVYFLESEYDPLAYTNNLLFNKLYNFQIIDNFKFKFRNQVRFDMLFFYKIYSQAKTYLYINSESLENVILRQVQYSIFDIVNQWTHIFNYYRRIKKYNELKDYIKYSYYKTMLHIWIWTISKTSNKILTKKAFDFANRKFEPKKEDFIKNNVVFLNTKDETFKNLVINFSNYIKEKLKSMK
ncbi:glycosyltransferase [Spiroplasma litorale]|uniref:Glycosyltransferase n=1 Tax=Spiroplasma litorale TaxID=216942 RepID=A0A0K1W0D3_9MOLU|nr:glycosyltransferase [Spiroplasma litorale]AKX33754.1 glycosyltransferase [Spiroplasma litorale]